MRTVLLLPFIPFLLTSISAALAQEELASAAGVSIAAVANDEVITTTEVQDRLRFVLATTGLSHDAETRARLLPQIVRQLVDEVLQMQEATRMGVTVSNQEVMQAVSAIEQQRGISPGGIVARLKTEGVPEDTFYRQVRAQLAWSQLVGRKLRGQVKVSEEELDRARLQAQEEGPKGFAADSVHIAVLALPVEKPEQEPQVRALAEKLVSEMKAGAPFEAIARELASASAGGSAATEPFWIAPKQLDAAVAKTIEKLPAGAVSLPVRTPEGYTIVKLLDRKGARPLNAPQDMEVLLKDVLIRLREDASPQEVEMMLQVGRDISRHPGTCTDKGIAGVTNTGDFDIDVDFRRMRTSELSDTLKEVAEGINVGGVSQPFATNEGIRFFMLCERVVAPPKMASRDETYSRLMNEKLQREAQKYMRNLRREAFIEVRL